MSDDYNGPVAGNPNRIARISGYAAGKVDTGWWQDQLRRGVKFRKDVAHELSWPKWRKYYRGEFGNHVLPSNVFFKVLRTVVPRVYFRNPSISIAAGKPGLEAAAFAKVLERTDNRLYKLMKLKKHVKKIVQNSFMFGTGFGKLGYGAEYNFTPDIFGNQAAPIIKGKFRIEYDSGIQPNLPWFRSVHPGHIILPSGCEDVETTRWIAHWLRRFHDDVRADPRLRNNKKLLVSRDMSLDNTSGRLKAKFQEADGMIDLIEVRDKKTGNVFVMCPSKEGDKILFEDTDDLQIDGGIPFYPLVFNEDDQFCWGTPDSFILEPLQLEINETKTQIMRHRRMSLVKILAKREGIKEEEAMKMVDETVLPVIFTEENPNNAIKILEAAHVPESLFRVVEEIMREIRENVGFGRNEFAEFNPGSADTTATEANIVARAASIRVDERRDMVADLLVNVTKDIHHIIFNRWNQDQVVDVVGPDGAIVWVSFKGTMLKNSAYEVAIDPDSTLPETKDIKESKALKVFELLNNDPLIDQIKLRKNLLRSLQGAQYEDMLIDDLGPAPGQNPENPMAMADFAKLGPDPNRQAKLTAIQGGRT